MTEIQFHRSDMAVVQGDKCAMLTGTQGIVFYNLWSRRGEWVSLEDMARKLDGTRVYCEDLNNSMRGFVYRIRCKLKDAGIDLDIENQRQTAWLDAKYRIPAPRQED